MPRHRITAAAEYSAPSGYMYTLLARTGLRRGSGASVSRPEPGRVFIVRDALSDTLTTVTVDALPTGGSRVTIASDVTLPAGIRGRIAGAVVGMRLRRAYRHELELLRATATAAAASDGWSLPLAELRAAGRALQDRPMQDGAMQAA